MRLFFVSTFVNKKQAQALAKLAHKKLADLRVALIENAADIDVPHKPYVADNRAMMQGIGLHFDIVDLRTLHTPAEVEAALQAYDVVWVGGGNTFYLRWIMRQSGFDKALPRLLAKGKVYVGGSAGAAVVGPTLDCLQEADDPAAAPELLLDGLHIINSVVVPHFDKPSDAPTMRAIASKLTQSGYIVQPLGDAEVWVVDGQDRTIL